MIVGGGEAASRTADPLPCRSPSHAAVEGDHVDAVQPDHAGSLQKVVFPLFIVLQLLRVYNFRFVGLNFFCSGVVRLYGYCYRGGGQ
jgi:hypothetical protein